MRFEPWQGKRVGNGGLRSFRIVVLGLINAHLQYRELVLGLNYLNELCRLIAGGTLDRADSYIFSGALVYSFVKTLLPLFGV